MATDKKCAHKMCTCMATKDSAYCSTVCEDSKGMTELACGCGHAGCEAAL